MLNHITIMGRLTRDPELRYTKSQVPVASFTVAVDRDRSLPDGSRETDFIDCVGWRQTGEFVSKYFQKGGMIVVDGRLQSRKWEDRDGNKRTVWEINVDRAYFGEAKRQEGERIATAQAPRNDSYKPAGRPVNVEPPEEGFYEMPGSGRDNPFQDPYHQADMFGGELPF